MATLIARFQKEGKRQQKGFSNSTQNQQTACHQVWSKAETQSIQAVFEVNKASAKAGHHFLTSRRIETVGWCSWGEQPDLSEG